MAKNEKTFNEQNMRKIIRILSGLSASQQQLAQQCINEYDPARTYQKDNICFFNGTLYRAKTVTNGNEPSPESTYFEMLDGVEEEIDAQYIETLMSTVSAETWDYLKNILSDQISTTHAWNSSTSYAQDQVTLQSAKDYTDQQVSKSLSKSYVVVNDLSLVQEDKYIYLVEQGDGSYLSYVLGKDGNPISFGDPNNVNLEGYAKTEDIANEYAKSSDLDSKFATITTTDGLRTDLNNHTNNIVAHLTQAERDKLVTTDDLGDYAKTVDLPTPRTDDEIKTLADGQIESSKQVLQFSDLKGITADSTLDEVVRAVPGRKIAILQSASFTNYLGLPHQMYTITINSLGYNRMQVFATSKYSDHASYVGACDNSSGVDVYDKWIKVITDKHVTTTINSSSTDTQVPSAKSVYELSKNARIINIPTWKQNVTITFTNTSGASALLLLQYGEYIPIVTAGSTAKIDPRTKVTTTPGNNFTWATDETNKLIITINNNKSNITGSIIINNDPGAIVEFGTNNAPQANIIPNPNYIADVPLTNITFSDSPNYKPIGTVSKYFIKNGICTIVLHITCETPASWVTVANVPKPSNINITQALISLDGTSMMRCVVGMDGILQLNLGTAGTKYIGTFSYPVAES